MWGGAERQVVDLADAFVERGHQVELVCLTGEADVVPQSDAIELHNLRMAKTPLGFLQATRKLGQLVRASRPDVVHSHMFHANILSRLARVFCPMNRLVCTAHNTNEGGRLRSVAYRVTDSLADVSTNVSQEAVETFVNNGAAKAGRMRAVYNGIDTERFRPAAEGGKQPKEVVRLLAVGRFYPQKDYPNLISALALIDKVGSEARDFRLDIVGDGPQRSKIEQLVASRGLSERVRFLGIRKDVPALMRDTDIFVLPSAWEGFGLVVAEAMASEKIVVATDCGGVREVMGGHGFLVPPKSPEKFAKALVSAMNLSEVDAAEMGRKGREHIVSVFGMGAIAEKWLSLYSGA